MCQIYCYLICIKHKLPTVIGEELRVVPGAGIEPARDCSHWFLRPTRLPIPPSGRSGCEDLVCAGVGVGIGRAKIVFFCFPIPHILFPFQEDLVFCGPMVKKQARIIFSIEGT